MENPRQDDSEYRRVASWSAHSRDDRDGRMYDDHARSRSPGDWAPPPPCPEDGRRRDASRRQRSRSPGRRDGHGYRDRDAERYRSPSPPQGRSRFGKENKEVMMDGLPLDMQEGDVVAELRNAYDVEGLDEVRVIRDRQTKRPRGLGFLSFRTIDAARNFLEQNHPYIYLYGPTARDNDPASKVRIAYSREREDQARARREGDWHCRPCGFVNYANRPNCFRCKAPRPELGPIVPPGVPVPKVANNGDNDAAPQGQPTQFLLFRGLDSSVTEQIFAKGAAKLYKPTPSNNDEGHSNPKKGSKVASTTGDANLGARQGSIRRVLLVRDRKTNASWRYGFAEFASAMDAQAALQRLNSFEKFTIASKPVLVTYVHAGVFVPVMPLMDATAGDDSFTFSPLGNPSAKLMYWDAEAYVSELKLSSDDNEAVEDKPQREKSKGKKKDAQVEGFKDTEKAKKRKADTVASVNPKKSSLPSQLQFWKDRQAELHGRPKNSDEKADIPQDSNEEPPNVTGDSAADPNAPPAQSYADPKRNFCYLCMRQFKDTASVNQHERLSQLHRENMQNEEAKARAMAKLSKHGINQPQPTEYRDRAKERRQAFARGKAGGPKPTASKTEEEPPVQSTSKGASLLSKMGWTEGSGLGAQGTGVTAPIATELYAEGVGLGAKGSKIGDAAEEAGRKTRGNRDEFLQKTKEAARQRFDEMNR